MVLAWVDTKEEYVRVCGELCRDLAIPEYKKRTLLIERELNKCVQCNMIDNPEKIVEMLMSTDIEMSRLGLNTIYALREKRLENDRLQQESFRQNIRYSFRKTNRVLQVNRKEF